MKMIYVSAVSRRHSLAAMNEFGCAYRRYNHQPIIQPKRLEHEKSNIASQKTGDAGENDSRDVDAEKDRAEVAFFVLHLVRCQVDVLRLRHDSVKRRTCVVYKSTGFICGLLNPLLSCFCSLHLPALTTESIHFPIDRQGKSNNPRAPLLEGEPLGSCDWVEGCVAPLTPETKPLVGVNCSV